MVGSFVTLTSDLWMKSYGATIQIKSLWHSYCIECYLTKRNLIFFENIFFGHYLSARFKFINRFSIRKYKLWKKAGGSPLPRTFKLENGNESKVIQGYTLWPPPLMPHQDKRIKAINNCQRASRAKTVDLRGGQLNATQSIAAGRKILDRAVKSVM